MLLLLNLRCLTRPALASQGHLSNCGVNHGPGRSHGPCISMVQSLETEFNHKCGFDDFPQREGQCFALSDAMFGSRFRLLLDWDGVFIQLCMMDAQARTFGGQPP